MKRKAKGILWQVYEALPRVFRRCANRMDFSVAISTSGFENPFSTQAKPLARGTISFSIDFELAWAWQYAKDAEEDYVTIALRERAQVPQILGELDRLRIPATWATVGHLFLTECHRGANGLAHPDMPRLPHFENEFWKFPAGDWYQNDPCSHIKRDPLWYAPDLIEAILSSQVRHELACHTFSHVGFGPYCGEDVAAAEVEACFAAMAPYGLKPRTWVYTGNEEGHHELLAQMGIQIIRLDPKMLNRVALPYQLDGSLWVVTSSSQIDRGKHWTMAQRLAWLRKLVDVAIEKKSSAHIWFHPSLPEIEMKEVLFPVFRYCAEKRDQGAADICTMEQLVDSVMSPRSSRPPGFRADGSVAMRSQSQ